MVRSKITNNNTKTKLQDGTFWSFGLVNKRLAEIFFDRKNKKVKFTSHFYVKREDYKSKQEIKWIEEDAKRVKLTYRKGKYIGQS